MQGIPAIVTVQPLGITQSLSFNGTTQYVFASANSAAQPNFSTVWWSTFWIKTTQSSGTPTIMANLDLTTHGLYVWMNNSGFIEFGLWATGAFTCRVITTGTAINDGKWHNVSVSNSGAGNAGAWSAWIDGAPNSLSTVTNGLTAHVVTSTANFTIGCDLTGSLGAAADFFNGNICQWAFTQGASINSTQATAIYNHAVATNLKGLGLKPAVWQYLIAPGEATGSSTLFSRGSATMTFSTQSMTSGNISTDAPINLFNQTSGHFIAASATVVSCGTNASLQPTKTTPFSFGFWAYADVATFTADMTFLGNDPANASGGWTISVNSGTFFPAGAMNFELDATGPTANFGINTAGGNMVVRTWTFYAGTYDGSNTPAGLLLYKNGSLASTSTYGSALSGNINGGFPFTIGAEGYGGGASSAFYVTGYMLNCTMWNRVLTSGEITSLYGTGHAGDASALSFYSAAITSYWRFASINGNDTTSQIFDRNGINNSVGVTGLTFSRTVP